VILLGAAALGLRWYQSHKNDPSDVLGGTLNTAGMVEAIQFGDDGDHVVAFNQKGEKIAQKGIVPGTHDADPVWRPDGNRVFFVSDRDKKSYQVYRWIPAPDSEPEVRSEGTIGKSHPTFPEEAGEAGSRLLMVSGGFVVEFDPSNLKGHQVLPPLGAGATASKDTEDAGGSVGQFAGIYGQLGDRFRIARWDNGTNAIVAVMGSDRGEVLIYQDLTKPGDPKVISTGAHIDFDINPKDGSVVFTVEDFLWPPKSAVPPAERFRHLVGGWSPAKGLSIMLPSRDDKVAFGSPAINPAGDKVLVVMGAFDRSSDTLTSKALITMPTEGNAAAGVAKLVEGSVYEPTWSPTGDRIAYAKTANGSRAIYIAGADGSGEHTLTGDTGTYGHPLFSPQTK
jgi:hypothetical protein